MGFHKRSCSVADLRIRSRPNAKDESTLLRECCHADQDVEPLWRSRQWWHNNPSEDDLADTPDYQAIFESVESTLIRIGNQGGPNEDMRQGLDSSKGVATKVFTDADYYRILVHVAFYSGFKAVIVDEKLPVIDNYFSDYQTVAAYGEQDILTMLADSGMIGHKGKIRGCIENAREFK